MTALSVAGTKGAQIVAKTHPPARHREEPHVGIFWLVDGRLVIDSTLLSQAEPYGDHLTQPRSHYEVWSLFQQSGIAPAGIEYEEPPRGRIMYNTNTRRFALLADRCILKDKRIVSKIMSQMNLPGENTDKGTDSHYRCFVCLQPRSD
jgi:hypothetical protein